MNWAYESINQTKNLHLPHRNWKTTLSSAHAMLIASSPGEVVCITGPSRAGKSRLINSLEKLLICGNDFNDNDLMPIVKILATNCSVGGTFSSKAFTLRALDAINHPFYSYNSSNDKDWGVDFLKQLGRTPETVLRPALEHALINRKTKYLFIDEAQHVLFSRGGTKDAKAILNSWKCLAQSTGVVLVLVGAYPLLDAIALCPHMVGRKHQIHLSRYRFNESDLESFLSIINSYSELVTLQPEVESLSEFADFLYDGSLGCIGLLESWIREALAYVIALDDSYLTLEHFYMSEKVDEDRKMVAAEIQNGEKFLNVNHKSSFQVVKTNQESSTSITPKQRKRKPFEKKPRRHKIKGRS